MKILRALVVVSFVCGLSLTAGCLSWEPGWKQAAPAAAKGDATALLAKAKRLENEADTKEKVQSLVGAFEDVLKVDPRNQEALSSLGTYCFLMGFGYSDSQKKSEEFYRKGIAACERAMYTNREFKARVDGGAAVWEACTALTKNEMNAMYHWYAMTGQRWSGLSMPGQLLNIKWAGRMNAVLDQMLSIDPSWNSGTVYMLKALFYNVAPGLFGGDMKKAGEYYDKAIAAGPHMISFYETRAKYYRTKMKDRKGFSEDLHHAIAIDPRKADTLEYPWAVWHRRNAMTMLKNIDRYFK